MELEITTVITFALLDAVFVLFCFFKAEVGIGVTCFGALSGERLAQLSRGPLKRKVQQQDPVLGDHST